MFSCYLHIKMPGEGGILPCYLHRRYRSIFSKKKSLRSKLPWCFYLSYQMCAAYITIYLHINYRVSFHICLPQWLKLPRCLYLNYQVYGVNVIVLFIEITRGRGSTNFFPMIKVTMMLSPKLSRLQCLWPCYLHIMYRVVYKSYHVGGASFIVVVMENLPREKFMCQVW